MSSEELLTTLARVLQVEKIPKEIEQKLLAEKITLQNFMLLDDKDLRKLGFPMGFRRQLLEWIKAQDKEEKLRVAFYAFDRNGDGYISVSELYQVMNMIGVEMSPAEAAEFVRKADINGDGVISYSEFMLLWS